MSPSELITNVVQNDSCTLLVKESTSSDALEVIRQQCDVHKEVCRKLENCFIEMKENDAQLEILNETADFLKQRHLRSKGNGEEGVVADSSREDLVSIHRQLSIWTRELGEVTQKRKEIELEVAGLYDELKESAKSFQIANGIFEFLHKRHQLKWRQFIAERA